MQSLISDPGAFLVAGWRWLAAFLQHADGRAAFGAGALATLLVVWAGSASAGRARRAAVGVLVAAAALAGATIWGGFQAAEGPNPSFEALWKTPNLQEYQQVR